MPYADPEKKAGHMRVWRKRVISQGYGRWLYQRRKLRFDDAERFRTAIEGALEQLSAVPLTAKASPVSNAVALLTEALIASLEADAALGPWIPPEKEDS
jgi:hypothetical protein